MALSSRGTGLYKIKNKEEIKKQLLQLAIANEKLLAEFLSEHKLLNFYYSNNSIYSKKMVDRLKELGLEPEIEINI